jgi:hypothetical protein
MRVKIYYAHSRTIYNSPREREERDWLERFATEVVCPNRDIGEQGTIEPYLKIITKCDAVVCSEVVHPVSQVRVCGTGVYQEVRHALQLKKNVRVLRKRTDGRVDLIVVRDAVVVNPYDWVYHARIIAEGDPI